MSREVPFARFSAVLSGFASGSQEDLLRIDFRKPTYVRDRVTAAADVLSRKRCKK
jgi:hypothetical protein